MSTNTRFIPIYTSRGDLGAYLVYPYIFDRTGEWIGWVTPDRFVYSVHGHYAGYLGNGPRVLRKLSDSFDQPRQIPPKRPERISMPVTAPLAPLMAELPYGIIDVFEDAPDLLPSIDAGELREDMD
jgi:hypothetical protein